MANKTKRRNRGTLGDPSTLASRDPADTKSIRVVIETPKGSRTKYAFDPDTHSYAHIQHVDERGKPFVGELEEFFVNYHQLKGHTYRVLAVKGPRAALRRIRQGMRAARQRNAKADRRT